MKLSGPILKNIDSKILSSLQEIAPRVAKKDINVWGNKSEAANRLNWIDLPTKSRDLLPELDALSAWARSNGLTQIILCGMGGSSLAPEVIAASYKKQLTTLDSTDPIQILDSLPNEIRKAVVVIGSKSGTTIETLSQFEFYQRRFKEADLNPIQHIVIITDPGTPLDISARNLGYKVVNSDPNVGGRFSALSAFGLVPAALIGVDISLLLDDAEKLSSSISVKESPAIAIAACLYSLTDQIINFCDKGSVTPGLSNWIEQLIAESTGKDLTGRLPVVIEEVESAISGITVGFTPGEYDLVIEATLGEQFILWEWVTALLCYLLKVNPFNQPNVTEAKEATSMILSEWSNKLPELIAPSVDEDVEIFGDGNTLVAALKNLIATTDAQGYIAIMAYLDRRDDAAIAKLRAILSDKSGRPVSFGWGPRFLHSTGQFHKGGQQNGSFLQITGECKNNFAIPGRDFDFKTLLMAQALGDARALATRKYPLLRLHLSNRIAGIDQILNAAQGL